VFFLKSVISLYFFFAVISTQFSGAYLLTKCRVSYIKVFSALVFCVSFYIFGYLMEINSINLQDMMCWNQVQYLGLPFVSVLWLMVALLYTKTIHILKRWMLFLLLFMPLLTFFIRLSNSWHHLYYQSWAVQQGSQYTLLHLVHGPWYYVNSFYILLTLTFTNILFYYGYLKSGRQGYFQYRFLALLAASLLPFIGIILNVIDFLGGGIDFAAFLMPISLFLIMCGIFKYDFLEIITLARDTIFESNSDGMLILNKELRIIDYNKSARDFFPPWMFP